MNSQMTNCSVTLKDVKIAKKIFGSDVLSIEKKETQKKPISVISDQIELLKKLLKRHSDVISCVNIVFINELAFFVTISIDIECRAVECVSNRFTKKVSKALNDALKKCNKAEFQVREIEADNEFNKLKKHAFDNVNSFIDSNVLTANEHAPEIKRNN